MNIEMKKRMDDSREYERIKRMSKQRKKEDDRRGHRKKERKNG